MQGVVVLENPQVVRQATVRLHYLDWLRVLAILGVFLYHASHPFDLLDWHIKNAEQSTPITAVLLFTAPWGMPFFFLIAGTGTWFALQHRTARKYVMERFKRLFIPFIFGCLLLTPLMLYFEWMHKTQTGLFNDSFWGFINSRTLSFGPQIFGWAGYHLWFLGFLLSFSMLGIPMFLWLRGETGQRMVSRLLKLCEYRGGMLLAIIPLLIVQVGLRIFFTEGEHNWTDFFYMFLFFVFGYLLYTNQQFIQLILRDSRLILTVAAVTSGILLIMAYFGDIFTWAISPQMLEFYIGWTIMVINGWSWTLVLLIMGLRFLNFSNTWLHYGQQAIVPFFVFHQPVIMVIAFFVVQWDAAILPKLLLVVLSSFAVTIGIYEIFIRRIGLVRAMFGMKS